MNRIYFILGPILAGLIGLVTVPVFTWYLTQEDLGRYNIFQSFLNIGTVFLLLGFDQVLVREYYIQGKYIILNNILFPMLIFCLSVFLLFYFWRESFWNNLFSDHHYSNIFLLFLIFLLNIYIKIQSIIFRMESKGFSYSCVLILPKLFLLVLLFCFSYFKINFSLILEIYLASLVLTLVCFSKGFFKGFKQIKLKAFDIKLFKSFVKYSLPLVPSSLAFVGINYSTIFFLKKLVDLKGVALFGVAMSFANIAVMVQTVIAVLWTPLAFKAEKNNFINFNISTYINLMLLMVTLLFVIFSIFSNFISYFLPVEYKQVNNLVVGCILPSLIYCVSLTTTVGIGITRKSYISLISSIVGLVFNVIFCIFLIERFEVVGAIISNMLAFFITFIINTEYSNKIWMKFSRLKVYGFFILMILFSILVMQNTFVFDISISYYSIFFILIIFFARKSFKDVDVASLLKQIKSKEGS